MTEVWRQIFGYGGLYEISDQGMVKSHHKWRGESVRVLIPQLDTSGYHFVSLRSADLQKSRSIHQLVAEAFISTRPSEKHGVNHIDGIKTNNCVDNLEWVTHSENHQHAHRIGLGEVPNTQGINNGRSKLTVDEVIEIRYRYSKGGVTYKSLACEYGVSFANISFIVKRKSWSHV